MKKLSLLAGIAFLAACASHPDTIKAAYVSPEKYKEHDCQQIRAEAERVSARVAELHKDLKVKADNDAGQMAVGLVLFWPALFLLEGGDGPEAQEYAQLKGEKEALEAASNEKSCGVSFQPAAPAKSS